jgi:hypothetical protein
MTPDPEGDQGRRQRAKVSLWRARSNLRAMHKPSVLTVRLARQLDHEIRMLEAEISEHARDCCLPKGKSA